MSVVINLWRSLETVYYLYLWKKSEVIFRLDLKKKNRRDVRLSLENTNIRWLFTKFRKVPPVPVTWSAPPRQEARYFESQLGGFLARSVQSGHGDGFEASLSRH